MDKKQLTEAEKAVDFFEELLWFLESKKNLRLKGAPDSLRKLLKYNTNELTTNYVGRYGLPNSNIHYLIGILPELFQDEKLFPTNIQIAKFAEEMLGIKINRYEKRSKYELIGLIVCKTSSLSDNELFVLVNGLSELTQSKEKLDLIRNIEKNDNFSWNETIQKLTER